MIIELQPGEVILATLRKHYILFLAQVGILFFLFIIPFVFSLTTFSIPFLNTGTATFFAVIWMLVLFVRGFVIWTNYYLDIWIVTNIRLVDIEQISLFNRKSSTLELEHIEDITVKIEGFAESMIGYGTLSVQTAGHIQEFVINDIANPEEAKRIIYDSQHKTKEARHERIIDSGLPSLEQSLHEDTVDKKIDQFYYTQESPMVKEVAEEIQPIETKRIKISEEPYTLQD